MDPALRRYLLDKHPLSADDLAEVQAVDESDESGSDEDWQRGDVVRDDTSNLFCYHNLHGWFGLASNQCSARGHYERGELADPLTLIVRGGEPVAR